MPLQKGKIIPEGFVFSLPQLFPNARRSGFFIYMMLKNYKVKGMQF